MNRHLILLSAIFSILIANAQAEVLVTDKAGIQVNTDELDTFVNKGPVLKQKKLLENTKKIKSVTLDLYKLKALANQAKALGLGQSKAEKIHLQKLIDDYYAQLLLQKYVLQDLPDFTRLAKKEYQVNSEKYLNDVEVDVAHILIDFHCRTKESALELAKDLRQRILDGEDFKKVLLEFSDDPTKEKSQGELGLFKRGKMLPAFDDAAFGLAKPGDISDVVETQYGFHIVKLNRKIPATKKDFEEVKREIIIGLRAKMVEGKRQDLIADLMEENKAKLMEDALDQYISNKLAKIKNAD